MICFIIIFRKYDQFHFHDTKQFRQTIVKKEVAINCIDHKQKLEKNCKRARSSFSKRKYSWRCVHTNKSFVIFNQQYCNLSMNQLTKQGAAFGLFFHYCKWLMKVAVNFFIHRKLFIFRVKVVRENQTISATNIVTNAASHNNFRISLTCVPQPIAGAI